MPINLIPLENDLNKGQNDLLEKVIETIDSKSRKSIKSNLIEINRAVRSGGNSILIAAKLLSEIKKLLKNKNWIEVTESGLLLINGRAARDLASAYENWLKNSSIPDAALTQVSARTLARIGKVEPSLRLKVENQIKEGKKYTERDLSNFLQKSSPSITHAKSIDELTNKALITANNMSETEKVARFPKLFIENIKLKKKIQSLESKIIKLTNN